MKWSNVLFWFIRHGRTEANDENIYRSWSNSWKAQLDKDGRRDADEAGTYLAAIKAPIELIIADSLDRTIETAERIGYKLGVKQFVFLRGLHPLNMGDYTLKSKDRYPVTPFYNDENKRIPHGETRKEFNVRQQDTFEGIMGVISTLPSGAVAIIGHGSNVSYLHNHVFNRGEPEVVYEGLVDPGGVVVATHDELKPLTKIRSKKNEKKNPSFDVSVEKLTEAETGAGLERWAVLFVGGKDTNREPKSCFNCPHLFEKQKTCEYIGPSVRLGTVKKDGELYTPVCGYQIGGKPTVTDNPKYLGGKDPDELGLEWAKGKGTNCYGWAGGAPCEHFSPTKGEDGICLVMEESDNKVDSDDCCAAHKGPSIPWQEAQKLLKDKNESDAS